MTVKSDAEYALARLAEQKPELTRAQGYHYAMRVASSQEERRLFHKRLADSLQRTETATAIACDVLKAVVAGYRPNPTTVEWDAWFNSLSDEAQESLRTVAAAKKAELTQPASDPNDSTYPGSGADE